MAFLAKNLTSKPALPDDIVNALEGLGAIVAGELATVGGLREMVWTTEVVQAISRFSRCRTFVSNPIARHGQIISISL